MTGYLLIDRENPDTENPRIFQHEQEAALEADSMNAALGYARYDWLEAEERDPGEQYYAARRAKRDAREAIDAAITQCLEAGITFDYMQKWLHARMASYRNGQ